MNVELLRITNGSFNLISRAYRLCYASMPKDNIHEEGKFIEACIKNGHETPLEHCSVTFLISGISRACSHQLVRHRLASFTQESQRYVGAINADYVIPESIVNNNELVKQFKDVISQGESFYVNAISAGVKKEDARFILSQAIRTRIMVTMNFRELRHFFKLRLDKRAQWEIRGVAKAMLQSLKEENVYYVFSDLIEKYL